MTLFTVGIKSLLRLVGSRFKQSKTMWWIKDQIAAPDGLDFGKGETFDFIIFLLFWPLLLVANIAPSSKARSPDRSVHFFYFLHGCPWSIWGTRASFLRPAPSRADHRLRGQRDRPGSVGRAGKWTASPVVCAFQTSVDLRTGKRRQKKYVYKLNSMYCKYINK